MLKQFPVFIFCLIVITSVIEAQVIGGGGGGPLNVLAANEYQMIFESAGSKWPKLIPGQKTHKTGKGLYLMLTEIDFKDIFVMKHDHCKELSKSAIAFESLFPGEEFERMANFVESRDFERYLSQKENVKLPKARRIREYFRSKIKEIRIHRRPAPGSEDLL